MSISKVGVFLVSKPVPVTNGKFADHFRISSGDGLTFCQLTKTGRLPSAGNRRVAGFNQSDAARLRSVACEDVFSKFMCGNSV